MSVFSSAEIQEINLIADKAVEKKIQKLPPDLVETLYMTKKQACKYLKISLSTLNSRLNKSLLKSYCLGGKRILIKRTDLDALLQEKTKK